MVTDINQLSICFLSRLISYGRDFLSIGRIQSLARFVQDQALRFFNHGPGDWYYPPLPIG